MKTPCQIPLNLAEVYAKNGDPEPTQGTAIGIESPDSEFAAL